MAQFYLDLVEGLIKHGLIGSSKQMIQMLKMKLINASEAREGYKELSKCSQLAISAV